MMRVAVIGTGYVGLVTGASLGYVGHQVTCVDSDEEKIAALCGGRVPIYEPYLDELLNWGRQRGSIEFTTDVTSAVRAAEVIFISVGTPSLANGAPDLRFLEAAARSIGQALDTTHHRVIVNKSTVPIGGGNLVEMLIREASRARAPFTVVSNPEFLQEGSAVFNSLYPDRIVVGADDEHAAPLMESLYRPIIDQSFAAPPFLPRPVPLGSVPFMVTSLVSAEMVKYAANSFLAMKISFANEMASICERVGAEIRQVTQGIGLDNRIGAKFLNAGIGWGGSCFGKDLKALTHTALEYGYRPLLLEAAQEVNLLQRHRVIQKLQEKLRVLKGHTIGLLGLAFKPNTDDLRDAPSLTIARRLIEMDARVKVYDPVAMATCRQQYPELNVHYSESPCALASGSDAIVLVTEWDEFRSMNLDELAQVMRRPILIDGRNALNPDEARNAGFDYMSIGSGVRIAESARREHFWKAIA